MKPEDQQIENKQIEQEQASDTEKPVHHQPLQQHRLIAEILEQGRRRDITPSSNNFWR